MNLKSYLEEHVVSPIFPTGPKRSIVFVISCLLSLTQLLSTCSWHSISQQLALFSEASLYS